MNSFCSSTQVDDDIVAACADPLWPWAAEREYTSARQDIHYYNFNAANDMAFSLDPITAMGSSTRLLTQENFMYPDVPNPWSIPAQPMSRSCFCHDSLCSSGCNASLNASSAAYQPVGDLNWAGISPFATNSLAVTFNEGMSPNDSLASPTSVDEGAWFSEPGRSTCTTPSSSYGSGEVSWVAPEYGPNNLGNRTSPTEWISGLSWPVPAATFVPTAALGKRPREAEEPHDDGGRVDIHQIPPKKRARGDGESNGIPKTARSTTRTRHKPVAKRVPNTKVNSKPKEAGRGAERLASPITQGIYHQPLLGPLQQGRVEGAAYGTPIRVVGREDEKVVRRKSTMKRQGQQEEANKFEAMHEALQEDTKTTSGVKEFKCRLCPGTHLKTGQDFKRHCNTAEAHPLEISFCDKCGDFFARKDSLLRHENNPPPECKNATEEEGKKKREETELLHDDFLRGLEECLKTKTCEGFVPFSQIIKARYPESAKKNKSSKKNIGSSS